MIQLDKLPVANYLIGGIHRVHCASSVGDVGGPRVPRLSTYPGAPRVQPVLVPVADSDFPERKIHGTCKVSQVQSHTTKHSIRSLYINRMVGSERRRRSEKRRSRRRMWRASPPAVKSQRATRRRRRRRRRQKTESGRRRSGRRCS